MNRIFIFAIAIFSVSSFSVFGQPSFNGHGGVYYLGGAGIPANNTVYLNPDISGVVARFKWADVEISPDVFDWSFVNGEISKAINSNKKISLQPLGIPDWLGTLGVQQYNYLDENPNHATYGDVLQGVIPWDTIYIRRYKKFLQQMALHYSGNATVSYINAVGVGFSRNLPDSVIINTTTLQKQAFWKAFPYNADSLAKVMNKVTDYYMQLFPTTPLWCSVDYVKFEQKASGKAINYLASVYTEYGVSTYPDRFGLFREDLSACNPPATISSSSHWKIMQQNNCRTGAQMLWSVQDGPNRMNKCGIVPNTKAFVLDSAVQKGLSIGMRYIEIYGADINDGSLTATIQEANQLLMQQENACGITLGVSDVEGQLEEESASMGQTGCVVFPNPSADAITILVSTSSEENSSIEIYTVVGEKVYAENFQSPRIDINIAELPAGLYTINVVTRYSSSVTTFVKE